MADGGCKDTKSAACTPAPWFATATRGHRSWSLIFLSSREARACDSMDGLVFFLGVRWRWCAVLALLLDHHQAASARDTNELNDRGQNEGSRRVWSRMSTAYVLALGRTPPTLGSHYSSAGSTPSSCQMSSN